MPYANINYVKMELRLLNDSRFNTMSDQAQLLYMKLIILCARENNKVPRKYDLLKEYLRTKYTEAELVALIDEIKKHFPKVLSTKDYYYIKDLKEYLHWVRPRNSQGTPTPKEYVDQVIAKYAAAKNWVVKDMTGTDCVRVAIVVKKLLKRPGCTIDLILEAIDWVSKQTFCDWTMETIDKKWLDFISKKDAPKPAYMREITDEDIRRYRGD